jgi:hypothetical protein
LNQSKQKVVVSEGSGSWLEYLEFDGKIYWTVNDERSSTVLPNDQSLPEELKEFMLPSDSRFRPDIQHMLSGNMDEAEKEKLKLEEVQRNDKHLRSKAEKLRK